MSSQAFLWINLGFALALAGLFLLGRSRLRAPAKLRLRGNTNSSFPKNEISRETRRSQGVDQARNLNVIFMHNGHTFDAFEVLGIPAGARGEVIEKAYRQALVQADKQSTEFIDAAYRALKSAA